MDSNEKTCGTRDEQSEVMRSIVEMLATGRNRRYASGGAVPPVTSFNINGDKVMVDGVDLAKRSAAPNPDSMLHMVGEKSAARWADEFCKHNSAMDWSVMMGWFANAIESGITAEQKRVSEKSAADAQQAKNKGFDSMSPFDLANRVTQLYQAAKEAQHALLRQGYRYCKAGTAFRT